MRCNRSIFCHNSAIQSIGVCKYQLENDRSIQLGRIVFPAIILHGSYDFVIMFLSFLVGFNEDGGNIGVWVSIISLTLSIASVWIGWLYYLKESSAQIIRLNQIDVEGKFMGIASNRC